MNWRNILVWIHPGLLRQHATACSCPLCDRSERETRDVLGMAAGHPESLTRELPAGQEEELAALAARLWPGDEWAGIITDVRRAEGQS